MLSIITPETMRATETAFMQRTGTPGLLLMERAAQAVCDALLEMTDAGALFLCGPGNNGGDGYAAARLLAQAGRKACIWTLSNPEMLRGDAHANMLRCREMGIPVQRLFALDAPCPPDCGVVVDALFGTGLARPLSGLYADAADWMNACGLPVLAVDMPSGTKEKMVRAARTVTFHRLKPCHLLYTGRSCSGLVTVADIGIEGGQEADYEALEDRDIPLLLPPRAPDAHKGDCGHVLALAGSRGMAGAAALCATAALRGGAGLATVCCPDDVLPVVQCLAPCATCVPHGSLETALAGKRAIAAGPGLGTGAGPLLERLLEAPVPQVWDADALNWLGAHPRALGDRFVLTPHPGEAARLLGVSVAEVTDDPPLAAQRLFERYGAVALVKGATTAVHAGGTAPGTGRRALNLSGTPGMATGGSGDVLTGLIAALLAQGLSPFDAARAGAFLHGRAGERAAAARGVRSMTAQDLLDMVRID